MNNYRFLNNLFGWIAFVIASTTYLLTMEPTVSFWDCGEFIASAYHLQVGHQPGAPLFMMIGKVFSLLASEPKYVALFVNSTSALGSGATIMFLFWTITALSLKLSEKLIPELNRARMILIFGSGFVGALAYSFSDTFWFSAVESEVYALSTLSTAIVFWAILKWEAIAEEKFADKWLVFISFIIGLSIGLHLLNLLAIPAIVLVYHFRKAKETSFKGAILAFITGCVLVGIIQFGIIQYLIYFASRADILFVNSLHLPFGSGAIFTLIIYIAALVYGISYSIKQNKYKLNLSLLCLTFILFGFSSYMMIIERAAAKTAINLSNPDNPVRLLEYVGRDGYAQSPLLYGQYFDAEYTGSKEGKIMYRRGESSYVSRGKDITHQYNRNTIFPRIWSDNAQDQAYYRNWLNIPEGKLATFADNISFFASWQVGFMYWRYFLWNFAGKQDDVQGLGNNQHGNWLTGIKPIDAARLGSQKNLPESITLNEGYNRFYALPLILGIAGLIFQLRKRRNDLAVIGTLFFCTGIAIIFYINQDPLQVRERDYAFPGSFYAFSIWIGIGVLAVWEILRKIKAQSLTAISATVVCLIAVPLLMGTQGWNDHDRSNRYTAREMAINYLQSCAPNAILFLNADNDTYPLWYAQQVEGIRTDVRMVNMQLLNDDSYIDQQKKQLFASAPLPISMDKKKYANGTRDVLYYIDYGIADSVELKDVVDVMLSDNESDKQEMQDGSKENFLPTKKLHISVNPGQVVKTGTLKNTDISKITDKIEWTYNKNYITKSDLAVLDILAHNNWSRPVYFAGSLTDDTYQGLDKYLYNEGYAYRLLPLKRDPNDARPKESVTNSDVMYHNFMNRFELSGFNKAHYLDPESRRVSYNTWQLFNTLAENLITENKNDKARNLLNKALNVLPMRDYSIQDTTNKIYTAASLYTLGETSKANMVVGRAVSFLSSELNYLAGITNSAPEREQDLKMTVAILNEFRRLAAENKQSEIVKNIDGIYKKLES